MYQINIGITGRHTHTRKSLVRLPEEEDGVVRVRNEMRWKRKSKMYNIIIFIHV